MSDSTSGKPERRREPRYKVSCRCWVEQDSMTLFGTVTNLSNGGIFLRTLPLLEIGAGVEVKLSLDSGVVVAHGVVRWLNKPVTSGGTGGNSTPPGLGIEFDALKDGEEILHRYVKRVSLIPEPE